MGRMKRRSNEMQSHKCSITSSVLCLMFLCVFVKCFAKIQQTASSKQASTLLKYMKAVHESWSMSLR